MITRQQALQLAQDWIEAWNAHDLSSVLAHYTDDFEMSSPLMVQMGINENGTLKGKAQVADYWQKGLARFPDLTFTLVEVLACVDTVIIYYHSVNGKMAAELLMFNPEGKIYKAMGHYN